MVIDSFQIDAARRRFEQRTAARTRNEQLIDAGKLLAVDEPARVEKFLRRHDFTPTEIARLLAESSGPTRGIVGERAGLPEVRRLERVLGTNDLMGVAFLEQGLAVARSVGRIWITEGGGRGVGYGTGFLISPRLLLTNHHVLPDRALARTSAVEFDYQRRADGGLMPTSVFALDADALYFADQNLDYALVAVQPIASNGRRLEEFPFVRLIAEEGKAIAGQWMNVVQHPNGELKQLSLRENQLIDVLDDFLHYATDTAPGSSGSPVFNDRWEVVALHHSGVPDTNEAGEVLAIDGQVWRDEMGEGRIGWKANEGVRVSRVIAHLRARDLGAVERELLDAALAPSPSAPAGGTAQGAAAATPPSAPEAASALGPAPGGERLTWTIPLSISIQVGSTALASVTPSSAALTFTLSAAPSASADAAGSGAAVRDGAPVRRGALDEG